MNLRANARFRAGDFARVESWLVPKLLTGAENAAALVLAESQLLVPVASGELQSSGSTIVEWKGRRVVGYVQYSAHHAAFVEFGTGNTGRGTYPYDLPVSGVPITGAWIYDYKQQNWVGMASQPYLRPALDTTKPRVYDAFREALT